MLLVNGLQQDQNHEAEALPSYASMDEFPEKSPNIVIKIQGLIFQFLEKIGRSKDIQRHFLRHGSRMTETNSRFHVYKKNAELKQFASGNLG